MFWPHPTGMAFRDDDPVKYGLPGSSDIVGVSFGGYFCGIEVKTGYGRLRQNQVNFRNSVQRWGGIFIEARSIEQTVADLTAELQRRGAEQGNCLELDGQGRLSARSGGGVP